MIRRIAFAWLLAAIAALALAACGRGAGDNTSGKLRVVTTLEIFADFARNVGGDRVAVTALLPPGADPHTYELAPGQVAEIARADVIFVNGLDFEEAALGAIERNAPADAPVVTLSEGLTPLDGNPHFWLDVTFAMRYVERIRDALSDIDPEGEPTYAARADDYLAQLEALDADFRAAMERIPPERRKLVTFHDAFPYLAARYGLEVVAVVVKSPGREPSAADVAELARRLREQDVPAVFKEPQFNARVLELAARDAGVEVRELYSDALSSEAPTYIDMMRFNLRQLTEGLGGA
ncbi:MAG TPA: metal ABC transporter substrate-binding protein [Dehalococcoidia bacterium]|nr:metal ABC transporter substrate-binding protein [Dehalococcoidia bacterium]